MKTNLRLQWRGKIPLVFREVTGEVTQYNRSREYAVLARECYKHFQEVMTTTYDFRPYSLGSDTDYINHYWEGKSVKKYFVWDNLTPVGFIKGEFECNEEGVQFITLTEIFVLPQYRRMGVGKFLLGGFLYKRKYDVLKIKVMAVSEEANAFLVSQGLVPTETVYAKGLD